MTEPVEKHLKDYKRPDFNVETVELHVDICETETHVTATLGVAKSPEAAEGAPFFWMERSWSCSKSRWTDALSLKWITPLKGRC